MHNIMQCHKFLEGVWLNYKFFGTLRMLPDEVTVEHELQKNMIKKEVPRKTTVKTRLPRKLPDMGIRAVKKLRIVKHFIQRIVHGRTLIELYMLRCQRHCFVR